MLRFKDKRRKSLQPCRGRLGWLRSGIFSKNMVNGGSAGRLMPLVVCIARAQGPALALRLEAPGNLGHECRSRRTPALDGAVAERLKATVC